MTKVPGYQVPGTGILAGSLHPRSCITFSNQYSCGNADLLSESIHFQHLPTSMMFKKVDHMYSDWFA